ncbi:MAG: Fe-S protein assembly co-chaperone HscB [Alphaproteobacteria bacterium]|nr:Fe-S protein assembly co-chaperone HscB [Rhodospirillales bacterium]MCW9046078.1 Fe-S protein assembly co-chaperone HscB [Alphaproteobacteria bacterium]
MSIDSEIKAENAEATALIPCWSCKGPVNEGNPFCGTCEAVQSPGQINHFVRFGLPVVYRIDESELDLKYFELQRMLHPDRFVAKGGAEKALSQQQAISLNDAYETLKDPQRRADYMVHLFGTEVLPEGCNLVNDQELLMEAMEMREALLEAETADEVMSVGQRAFDDIKICIEDLADAFDLHNYGEACRLTTRLKYLQKLVDETKARRVKLMSV